MTTAAVQGYIQSLLDGLVFPPTMTGVPALRALITPLSPDVLGTTQPTCWIWPPSDEEARDPKRYSAGTIPRANYAGGPSGTKATEHQIEIYMLYAVANNDPDANTLFPGMVDAVKAVLRVSQNPVQVTDPWTGVQSWVVDVGENMRSQRALRALEDQALNEYSALITVPVVEIFSA